MQYMKRENIEMSFGVCCFINKHPGQYLCKLVQQIFFKWENAYAAKIQNRDAIVRDKSLPRRT